MAEGELLRWGRPSQKSANRKLTNVSAHSIAQDTDTIFSPSPQNNEEKQSESSSRAHKRKRHNTRGSFEEIVNDKYTVTVNNNVRKLDKPNSQKHVQFCMFQNNGEVSSDSDDSDEGAQGGAASNAQPPTIYTVRRDVEPIWKSAKRHRGNEQKASLRARNIEKALDKNRPPTWAYGLTPMPDFIVPMSNEMLALQKKQATDVARLAKDELRLKQADNKSMADNNMEICKDWYQKKEDTNYPKAEERIVEIVGRYRKEEKKKLQSFKLREKARYPNEEKQLKVQLAQRSYQPKSTRSRSATRGGSNKKRRRDNSSGSTTTRQPTSTQTVEAQPQPSTSSATQNIQNRGNVQQTYGRGFNNSNRAQRGGLARGRARGNSNSNYQPSRFQRGRGIGRGRGVGRGQYTAPENRLAQALKDILQL
jgi:hypothetical protein